MCGRYVVTKPVTKTAEIVKTSIKVEGEQISIKQNLHKNIISNQ